MMSEKTSLGPATPLLIVADLAAARDFYTQKLGFDCLFQAPSEDPFFAMLGRDDAQIMLKAVGPEVAPLPNPVRHPWAAWDIFIYVEKPDDLAAEFAAEGTSFRKTLGDTDDGLRGFEIADADGYVVFFGRPNQP